MDLSYPAIEVVVRVAVTLVAIQLKLQDELRLNQWL